MCLTVNVNIFGLIFYKWNLSLEASHNLDETRPQFCSASMLFKSPKSNNLTRLNMQFQKMSIKIINNSNLNINN